jgi:carbamoyltransferase
MAFAEKRFSEKRFSMPIVLGVNAVFHDPAAALVVDGEIVAAAEEERFSRRKHGKPPVAFSTWELPERAMAFCLAEGGVEPVDLDALADADARADGFDTAAALRRRLGQPAVDPRERWPNPPLPGFWE